MKLNPGEHTLMASFKAGPDAEAALNALKGAGFSDVQLDRVGQYGYRPEDSFDPTAAFRGKESSLVEAVLNPGQIDDEARILLGASTDASGMSAPDKTDDYPFLVTIVSRNEAVGRAVEICQAHGGRV